MTESNDIEETVRTLEEGTREEQKEAFRVLRKISKTQPETLVSHVNTICTFASDEDTEIRRDVASILTEIAGHEPSAVLPHAGDVCSLLLNDDPLVLAFATAVAMRITPESPAALADATERLMELLTYESDWAPDPASSTRSRAILALGDLAEEDPTLAARLDEPLAERLNDGSSLVRSSVVVTIKQLGLAHPEAVSTALAHLPSRLDDPDSETRYQTLLAIINFRHEQQDAIAQPDTVATALRQAVEKTDLTSKEMKTVAEAYKYIENN